MVGGAGACKLSVIALCRAILWNILTHYQQLGGLESGQNEWEMSLCGGMEVGSGVSGCL